MKLRHPTRPVKLSEIWRYPVKSMRIHRELGGMLALNCEVVRAGAVGVGDEAEVTDGDQNSGGSASQPSRSSRT